MLVVGLTGNYGSGKSLVLKMLEARGTIAVDADRIVGELLKERHVIEHIRRVLGEGVFNGARLDRKKMAGAIFQDRRLRRAVEDVLHPLVFERIDGALKGKEGIAVIEAALVLERGYEKRFDRIIVVFSPEETAIKRLAAKGMSREEALMRLRSQMPAGEKIKKADFVIDNSGTPEETEEQVNKIYEKLLAAEKNRGRLRWR